MRKRYIAIIAIVIISMIILFFNKTYLSFDLICTSGKSEFLPDAYVVINSEEKLNNFLYVQNDLKSCSHNFNFSDYTYVVVYGKEVKSMYYSYKGTYFDDKSAPYAPRWNSKVLFIEYETGLSNNKLLVYQISKEKKLREFFGV